MYYIQETIQLANDVTRRTCISITRNLEVTGCVINNSLQLFNVLRCEESPLLNRRYNFNRNNFGIEGDVFVLVQGQLFQMFSFLIGYLIEVSSYYDHRAARSSELKEAGGKYLIHKLATT